MLAKAKRYIASAAALRDLGDYDSAVSRLYYSMFYCAEALLQTKGLKYSSHRGVISAFGREFVKQGLLPQDMHESLHLAFEKRQAGDYEVLPTVDEDDVQDLLPKAERFLAVTEEFLKAEGHL